MVYSVLEKPVLAAPAGEKIAMKGTNLVVSPRIQISLAIATLGLPVLSSALPGQSLEPAFRIIEQAVADGDIPGASVLILRDGRPVATRAFGLCDIEHQRPFRSDTICWIASLTKPVTAAAAMTLVQQGRLGLDDPVEKYLPEFAEQKTSDGLHVPVTVGQLMSHSSGIQSSVPLRPRFFFVPSWYRRSLADVASAVAETKLVFKPGRQTQYSNAAPYVLGRIIEIQSGQSFGEYVQKKILDPLGMQDTGFAIPRQKVDRSAVVYRRDNRETVEHCRYDPQWTVGMTMPDGGLFSTPRDIARFADTFLNDGRDVLTKDSVDLMLTEQSDGYGLGWILDSPDQFSHWGSSGTLVWADRKTRTVGVLFIQIQDLRRVAELHGRFRDAVSRAMLPP